MTSRSDLLLAVRLLYGMIERFDASAAAELDVDRSALRAINAMEHGAVSPGALAQELGLSSGSVTALLDRLERAGHIERTLSRLDGRRRDAHLAPETRRKADDVYRRLAESIEARFAQIDEGSMVLLVSGINALAEAFDSTSKSSTSGKLDP